MYLAIQDDTYCCLGRHDSVPSSDQTPSVMLPSAGQVVCRVCATHGPYWQYNQLACIISLPLTALQAARCTGAGKY